MDGLLEFPTSPPPPSLAPPSSPQTEPKMKDSERITKVQITLGGIKQEIFENISNYERRMTTLMKNFIRHPDFQNEYDVLSKGDKKQLFMSAGQVASYARYLKADLEEYQTDSSLKGVFRVVYEHFTKYFADYVAYLTELKGMEDTLNRLLKDKNFAAVLSKMEQAKDNESFRLKQFFHAPKERMFNLKMILERAKRYITFKAKEQSPTKSDQIEADNCSRALKIVIQIIEESNKRLGLKDMCELYDEFVFPETMTSPLCRTTLHQLLKKGEVTKHAESIGRSGRVEYSGLFKSGTKLWLFLFDHYILLARKKAREMCFVVQDFCPTDRAVITTKKRLDNEQKLKDSTNGWVMVLVLKQNHKNERVYLVLTCAQATDRDDWLDKMTSLHITIGVGASHLYGKNLIANCSGQDLLSHWQILASAGDGWKVEVDPERAAPFPGKQTSCFDMSYCDSSAKQQTIDLGSKGVSPRRMDDEPHILVGEWYAGRCDSASKYELKVELLDEDGKMLAEYIFKEKVAAEKGGKWKHVSHEFRNYGKGVRQVRFCHGGKQGIKMTNATVQIKNMTAGNKKGSNGVDTLCSDYDDDSFSQSSSDEDHSPPVAALPSGPNGVANPDKTKPGSTPEAVNRDLHNLDLGSASSEDEDTGLIDPTCFICSKQLRNYFPVDGKAYCLSCYEEKILEKCVKCKQAIRGGGCSYGEQPWHVQCFVCTHCHAQLFGAKFVARDGKCYCQGCYAELYAERCASCCKPIAESAYKSCGDRCFHTECVKCAHCNAELAGQRFYVDSHDNFTCLKCHRKHR